MHLTHIVHAEVLPIEKRGQHLVGTSELVSSGRVEWTA